MDTLIHLYDDEKGFCELLEHMGSDLDIINSARVSFDVSKDTLDAKDSKLIHYLYKSGHTTPFEHCTIKFKCYVPLFVARQHMRHRTWSFNEVSRRYTTIRLEFYTPSSFRSQHKSNRQGSNTDSINPIVKSVPGDHTTWVTSASQAVQKHVAGSLKLYNTLLEQGVCREQARMVLPQNMYCKYIATANLHNILRFIHLRNKEEAQWEIQVLAQAMAKSISHLYPVTWEAYNLYN